MERKFGVEMEITGITREQALKAIQAVGIKVQIMGYTHVTTQFWKIVPDSSVNGGFEVVSPILSGQTGLSEVEIVATALENAGATTDNTCGLHVHFSGSDLTANTIKNIFKRYRAHEDEIDAFMPKSRRRDNNTYCQSLYVMLPDRHMAKFLNLTTISEMAKMQPDRYFKVNLKSYQRHGTIEFRQHAGTVNATKILNWIRFLDQFITSCVNENTAVNISPSVSPANKKLMTILAQGRAVTNEELCGTLGWLEHTLRSAISRLRKRGIQIRPVKVNGKPGYQYLETSGQEAGESLWRGISKSIELYYKRVAAVYAVAA